MFDFTECFLVGANLGCGDNIHVMAL